MFLKFSKYSIIIMHYISKNFFINTHKICDFFFWIQISPEKLGQKIKKEKKRVRSMNFLKQDLYKGYISFITPKICYFELLLSSFKVKQNSNRAWHLNYRVFNHIFTLIFHVEIKLLCILVKHILFKLHSKWRL